MTFEVGSAEWREFQTKIGNRTGHDVNCRWQLDQCDFECSCGISQPAAPWFIPFQMEVLSKADRIWKITQDIAGGSAE